MRKEKSSFMSFYKYYITQCNLILICTIRATRHTISLLTHRNPILITPNQNPETGTLFIPTPFINMS